MNAIEIINAEMQKHPDDPYIEEIGHHLIDKGIESIPEGCTLLGAEKLIEDYARSHRKGNRGVCPPSIAFAMVDEYYGIKDEAQQVTGKLPASESPAIDLADFF